MASPSIMVSCGEPSGDLYAAALVRELHALRPAARVFGYGGPRLEAAGAELVGDFRGLSVTGLAEAVRLLPKTLAMLRHLGEVTRRRRPDVLVLVDLPDFNFRLGAAARTLGIPVVYYVSPQLWAWRPRRLETLRRFVSRMLVIFPFEEPLYRHAGVPVTFVGHPLLDLATAREDRSSLLARLGLDPSAPTVALLPGSRRNEVDRLLPVLVDAAALVERAQPGTQFLVARAPGLDNASFATARRAGGPPLGLVEGVTDEVLAAADVVVTASGTATVQAAIHGRPMVIVYKLSPLTYRLGKPFVRVSTYGMVNLVADRRIVPELIQDDCTPRTVAAEVGSLLTDRARAEQMRADLSAMVARLGAPGASRRAAQAVLDELDRREPDRQA
jgi:lipid-A-disaccharide synthase